MEQDRANILRHMQICRFCLNPDENLTNIHQVPKSKNTVPLSLQLMACVAIEVLPNDEMPQLICNDCRSLALQSYSFKTNCKKADYALKLFLATGNLSKPLSKKDFVNYIPKNLNKLRKVRENLPVPQDIKIELEHTPLSDENEDQIIRMDVSESEEQPQGEVQIKETSANEYSVKLVSPVQPKPKIVGAKIVDTDCFSCTQCEKSFPLKQLLEIHMKNHSRELNLRRHEKTVHENVAQYLCSFCDASFIEKEDLIAHSKKQHSKKKPFSCSECGKSFVFKQGLERHAIVHTENKPYKCSYCEASFSSSAKLARHVTTHAGLRPYPCKLCKRTFLLSHHLTRHVRSHYAAETNNVQQIGQHKCDICSMSFRRKDSLINHSAIHSMVNLKCVICYTEFDNAQNVKEHITSHLSGLPHPCEKCDYSFETKEQLEEHEVKHAEMEYEEQIEKEVVEEARVQGKLVQDPLNPDDEDFDEYGGDHMGRHVDDDEDYTVDMDAEDTEMDFSHVTDTTTRSAPSTSGAPRRSARAPRAKDFSDFLKDELQSDNEEGDLEDGEIRVNSRNVINNKGGQHHQTADIDNTSQKESEEEGSSSIRPIIRTEGTKVYQRKTPIRRPKIVTSVPTDKIKTAPLSQINQPQVTTIENLGLTKQDLQALPTEKYVDMKIGNKTVRVQKLVLTKEEMKAMAKEGKIRGNTVLIKNPGNLNPLSKNSGISKSDETTNKSTKTYKKKNLEQHQTQQQETHISSISSKPNVIINDIIIDNLDEDDSENSVHVSIDLS